VKSPRSKCWRRTWRASASKTRVVAFTLASNALGTVTPAEEMVRQVEGDVRRRQEQLRAEVRMLEQRKRDSIERLEEIAALVQDVLPSRSDDSLVGDLKPERPART